MLDVLLISTLDSRMSGHRTEPSTRRFS